MSKRCLITICFAFLAVNAVLAQEKKSVPPPPKPADDGPSLEVTMKFIQDKMNDQGPVFTEMSSNLNPMPSRSYSLLSDVVADVSTCTLHVKRKVSAPDGAWENVETSTIPFKDVDSIAVESAQDTANRQAAENGHPEVSVSYRPDVYGLSLKFHRVSKNGKEPPQSGDSTGQFSFRDQQTADRIAKAMTHAVELCGGGNKEPF